MRITVAFKVTPDYEALRPADWEAAMAGRPQTRFAPRILNCFDESALELALRLRDTLAGGVAAGGGQEAPGGDLAAPGSATRAPHGVPRLPAGEPGAPVELCAVSVAGRDAEPYLKTLLALGYSRAARVDISRGPQDEAAGVDGGAFDVDFAAPSVAELIACFVDAVGGVDLLLLGCRSGPADSGTVPFLLSEALGWPCLTGVTEIEPLSDERMRVLCAADEASVRLTVRTPCILAIGNAVVSRLRVPTLLDRLASRDSTVEVLSASALGAVDASWRSCRPGVLTGLEGIRRDRRSALVGGEGPRAKARSLYDDHLASMIEGL